MQFPPVADFTLALTLLWPVRAVPTCISSMWTKSPPTARVVLTPWKSSARRQVVRCTSGRCCESGRLRGLLSSHSEPGLATWRSTAVGVEALSRAVHTGAWRSMSAGSGAGSAESGSCAATAQQQVTAQLQRQSASLTATQPAQRRRAEWRCRPVRPRHRTHSLASAAGAILNPVLLVTVESGARSNCMVRVAESFVYRPLGLSV